MPKPTWKDLKDAIDPFKDQEELLSRLSFTLLFWIIIFWLIKELPALQSPVLTNPLKELQDFTTGQVSGWLVAFQLIALALILLLSIIPINFLFRFRKVVLDESVRIYYNGCLTVSAYGLVNARWDMVRVFFTLGVLVPYLVRVVFTTSTASVESPREEKSQADEPHAPRPQVSPDTSPIPGASPAPASNSSYSE